MQRLAAAVSFNANARVACSPDIITRTNWSLPAPTTAIIPKALCPSPLEIISRKKMRQTPRTRDRVSACRWRRRQWKSRTSWLRSCSDFPRRRHTEPLIALRNVCRRPLEARVTSKCNAIRFARRKCYRAETTGFFLRDDLVGKKVRPPSNDKIKEDDESEIYCAFGMSHPPRVALLMSEVAIASEMLRYIDVYRQSEEP